ncbi:maturation protein [ssRNA phage Gerhypos.4_5]|uniref:Maturation protein n=2 Tax=Norzivirales TaxID=2842247 RepID=A0A8S5L2V3_9VIRU|nr:maturation protein [ssRNA phage Gerhypos.4_5]QDH86685.1 MAG: hypothetical protein H4Bulk46294e4103_000003 [Leviviridae sp.]DAD51968.1 TPA_asm: maturation protein [ssRNA phage Gerhypos.4_5]
MSVAEGQRTRTEDHLVNPVINRSYWWDSSMVPKPALPAFSPSTVTGSYRSMVDYVSAGFKRRSAAGEVINKPMYSQVLTATVTGTGPHFVNSSGGVTYHGELEGIANSTLPMNVGEAFRKVYGWASDLGLDPDWRQMSGLAATSCAARVAKPPFDGLVSLGELRETLHYLQNPFKTGLKLATSLVSGVSRLNAASKTRRVAQDFMSLYLEFRYGVRPLVKEVDQLLVHLETLVQRPKRQTARGTSSYRNAATQSLVNQDYSGLLYDSTIQVARKSSVRAGLLYEWREEVGLTDHWGFKLSDLPSAAWALMPLSFVVDWVANVGTFVSAITPRAGYNQLAEWTTTTDELLVTVQSNNYRVNVTGWSTSRAGESLATYLVRTVQRTPHLQLPSLEMRGFDTLRNDALRLLDLIGIFQQKLGSVANSAVARRAEREWAEKYAGRVADRLTHTPSGGRASWLKTHGVSIST